MSRRYVVGVKQRTQDLAGEATGLVGTATGLVGTATGEARWRARATRDALAGRRPRLAWPWLAVAAAAGVVAGLVAGVALRRATVEQAEALALEEAIAEEAIAEEAAAGDVVAQRAVLIEES